MPRLIPDLDPSTIPNFGEREVYRQLRDQLPDSWVVRHHYPACWFDGRFLQDCEGDFIILAPGKGLLVVEVKSSHGYHCEKGVWYRVKPDGRREQTRNPFEQASAMKHRLVERISRRVLGCTKSEFPGIYGHVVIYPFCRVQHELPPSTDPLVMLTYSHMRELRQNIEKAFSAWGDGTRGNRFSKDILARVERFLTDDSRLVPVLAADVDRDERQIEELTRHQFRAFRGILSNRQVHVRGTAGSGKTLIALWAAERFAKQGKQVLFLCFNKVLAAWLETKHRDQPSLTIRSFFSLCRHAVARANLPFRVPGEEEAQQRFWTSKAPVLFCQALDECPEVGLGRFDVVIVDEAQDFHEDWWFPVQMLLRDNGQLCLFSDPEQSGIYGNGAAFPAGLIDYHLSENCRNTKKIVSYCSRVLNKPVTPFQSSPTGVVPEVLEPHDLAEDRAHLVARSIGQLTKEGFSLARMALLSPWRLTSPHCAISFVPLISGETLGGTADDVPAWLESRLLWASTIKSFKGLEADCVIVTDVPSPSVGFNLTDLYVASSRAKHRLFLLPTSLDSFHKLSNWLQPPGRPRSLTGFTDGQEFFEV